MSLDKLNKLNKGGYKGSSSYESKSAKPAWTPPVPEPKGVLEDDHNLIGKIRILQDEVNNLKYDIMTLFQLMDGTLEPMRMQEIREAFTTFRSDPLHIMNRVSDKREAIIKDEIKING